MGTQRHNGNIYFPPKTIFKQRNWQYFSVMLEDKSRTDKKDLRYVAFSFLFLQ
jgi:hypothetical protein